MNTVIKSFLFFLVIVSVFTCQQSKQHESAPSTASDSTASATTNSENQNPYVIKYHGAEKDSVYKELTTFPLFDTVRSLSEKSMKVKYDLMRDGYMSALKNHRDSLSFMPSQLKAIEAIRSYEKIMAAALFEKKKIPSVIHVKRKMNAGDETIYNLPRAFNSDLLTNGNFFFLGGAPLIHQHRQDDRSFFKDANGNIETRFVSKLTENSNFIFTSINYFSHHAAKLSFGEPVYRYFGERPQIDGIGSITHEFINRTPVIFLTESGPIPGSLISVSISLFDEVTCESGRPISEFACAKNISEDEILAIYIPFDQASFSFTKIYRASNSGSWSVDLNGDEIPDNPCFIINFASDTGDTLAEAIWFANINGVWQIIDWGRQEDCT